jgi:predicted acylesterase/phospholipase RssA
MTRIGLALSGGGFRATLYHLGLIRALRDAGELGNVTDIASVSGGSILAAHVALNWDRYTGDDAAFAAAAGEIVRFVQFDIRNHIVRRMPILFARRLLARLIRRDMRHLSPNTIMEHYYRKLLYGDKCLYELPDTPRLHILTTNVSDGVLSIFNKDGLFVQIRGGEDQPTADPLPNFQRITSRIAALPRVVAASAAFPGFFPPVEISAADLGARDGQFPTESFTDGGVYDNLGIRALAWLRRQGREFDHVLVSDAGKPFQILADRSIGIIAQSIRASDILWDRVWQLEREHLGRTEDCVFVPITELVHPEDDPTAQHMVVQSEVCSIRTDLDRFSSAEINALVRHGYEVTRKIARRIGLMPRDRSSTDPAPWGPMADAPSAAAADGPAPPDGGQRAAPATLLARSLRCSSRRRVFSTLLDPKDWTSYLYLALAVLLFIALPTSVYRLHRHATRLASVIDSIAEGDPDIRQILDLFENRTSVRWQDSAVEDVAALGPDTQDGIEVLSQSRTVDLRSWRPEAPPGRRGSVAIYDRATLRFADDYKGDGTVAFTRLLPIRASVLRQPAEQPQGRIRRLTTECDGESQLRCRAPHQIVFDLGHVPRGERITLQLLTVAEFPEGLIGHMPFHVTHQIELLNAWMLFPENHPYTSFQLVQYPEDGSSAPVQMNPRYTIDHPYGSLIGWSVIRPTQGLVYECRWKTD